MHPLTLIIPAHNEAVVIEAKLQNALAIDYPKDLLEIIVASDGSRDDTVEIARRFEDRGVRVMAFPDQRGKASAVNDAVATAGGDLLCLCDANVMFEADALRRMVARMDDPRIGAVSGDVQLRSEESNFGDGESLYYRFERAIQLGESRVGSMMGVDGGMYVIRRELFQPLPADTILDDFVLSMHVIRQGKKVVYEPTAIATENGTPTATQEYRRRVRVAAGGVQAMKRGNFPPVWRPVLFWQFVSHKLLRWISPLLLLALLISNVLLWNRSPFYQVTLIGQGVVYSLALLATFSIAFRQTRLGGIPFYFTMSHVAMADGLFRGLFNLQRVTWKQAERKPVESPQ